MPTERRASIWPNADRHRLAGVWPVGLDYDPVLEASFGDLAGELHELRFAGNGEHDRERVRRHGARRRLTSRVHDLRGGDAHREIDSTNHVVREGIFHRPGVNVRWTCPHHRRGGAGVKLVLWARPDSDRELPFGARF